MDWARSRALDDVVAYVLRDPNPHQDGLVDTFERLIEAGVVDDLMRIGEFDREVVHDLPDLFEDRQHRLLALVAILASRMPAPRFHSVASICVCRLTARDTSITACFWS